MLHWLENPIRQPARSPAWAVVTIAIGYSRSAAMVWRASGPVSGAIPPSYPAAGLFPG